MTQSPCQALPHPSIEEAACRLLQGLTLPVLLALLLLLLLLLLLWLVQMHKTLRLSLSSLPCSFTHA
jgi:hypothetical protein